MGYTNKTARNLIWKINRTKYSRDGGLLNKRMFDNKVNACVMNINNDGPASDV